MNFRSLAWLHVITRPNTTRLSFGRTSSSSFPNSFVTLTNPSQTAQPFRRGWFPNLQLAMSKSC